MLDAEEAAELRNLQTKAYRRDGGLTAAESRRLAALEQRRRAASGGTGPSAGGVGGDRGSGVRAAEPAVDGSGSATGAATGPGSDSDSRSDAQARSVSETHPDAHTRPDSGPRSASGPDAASTPHGSGRSGTPSGRVLRLLLGAGGTHPLLRLAGAAGVLLAIGVGLGWLAFRDHAAAVPLSADQQARGAELAAKAEHDPGSLTALAEEDGVVVWMLTQEDGARTCLLIDAGEEDSIQCDATETLEESGLHGALQLGDTAQGREMIHATVLLAASGDPVALVERVLESSSDEQFLSQFTDPAERATAERLLDDGFDEWSPAVVGYLNATPIWTATRSYGQETCLFYGGDADAPSRCERSTPAPEDGIELTVIDTEVSPPAGYQLTLHRSMNGMPSLMVEVLPTGVGPEADAGTIDDKTGETGDLSFDDLTQEPPGN